MGRLPTNQEYSRSVSVPIGDRSMLRTERGSHLPRMASSPEEKYNRVLLCISLFRLIILARSHDSFS